MSKLTDEQITALVDSLDEYQEQRIRDTIALARDPEAAGQLIDWLRNAMSDEEDFEWIDRLSTISVALSLGEAGAIGVIPVLLDRLIRTRQTEFTDALFQYVLCRMGEPMVRAVMERIPEIVPPAVRSDMYWLVDSAHQLSPAFQHEVADFCCSRMPIERELPADRQGTTAWYSCCRVLITLNDWRVEGLIDKGLRDKTRGKRRESWERLQISARDYAGQPMKLDADKDYRIDWPIQAPQWEAIYRDANAEYGDDPELGEMLQLVDTITGKRSTTATAESEPTAQPIQSTHPKIPRNAPCPCGSGKKFKKCCGAPGKAAPT